MSLAPPKPSSRAAAGQVSAGQRALNRAVLFVKAAFRRLLIWFFSLFVAFYVPIHEVGPPFWTDKWTDKVVAADKSSDVFLGVVAMVILSATDILDGIISRRNKQIDSFSIGCCWLLLAMYGLFIFYGMPSYANIPPKVVPPWLVIKGMLLMCLFGEVIIALSAD
jgi:phosphatidylglycerophosphate synthase